VGRRGPASLPTRVKLLHGETRPSRLNHNEPRPPSDAPVMPADLEPAAQKVWARVMATQAPGVILAAHTDTLRLYCEWVVRYEAWSRHLARSGPLIKGARGHDLVRNPLVAMVRDAGAEVRVLARELGLTPSSLSGVHVAPEPADSAMLALLTPRRRTG
jgi:P27 family predicted phage terminase small subunit